MSTYNVLIEKEYKKLIRNEKSPIISCLMMVKNEKKRIQVSLDSITGTVDCLIVYDTGSTDNTIEIITEHCEKHKLNLYMIQGEFVNFCVSRNVSLDYADTKDIDFILLLDTNDELRDGDKLIEFSKKEMTTNNTAYLICQCWWSGKFDKYFNTRFIKANKGWRYNGSVHEWMSNKNDKNLAPYKMTDEVTIFQDRTKDDDKSSKRYIKDKELLLIDHKANPEETRTLFYLAQTCSCLDEIDESFYYYKLRQDLEGFQEEKFHSYLRCGELSQKMNHDWHESLKYYMKAIEHSDRAEPLIHIAQHYNKEKKWFLAYSFIKMACSLPYPSNAILFVDKHAYDYTRWHIMGIVAYYCGKYTDGKEACLKAINCGLNSHLDKNNLSFYEKKEKGNSIHQPAVNTKNHFLQKTIQELQQDNSNIPIKKLQKMALSKWKSRENPKNGQIG